MAVPIANAERRDRLGLIREIVASSSTPTPAEPPVPCTQPDPERLGRRAARAALRLVRVIVAVRRRGVRMKMSMLHVPVAVGVGVEAARCASGPAA